MRVCQRARPILVTHVECADEVTVVALSLLFCVNVPTVPTPVPMTIESSVAMPLSSVPPEIV